MGSYRWEVGYILCKKDFIFQNTYGTDRSFRLEDNEDSTLLFLMKIPIQDLILISLSDKAY